MQILKKIIEKNHALNAEFGCRAGSTHVEPGPATSGGAGAATIA